MIQTWKTSKIRFILTHVEILRHHYPTKSTKSFNLTQLSKYTSKIIKIASQIHLNLFETWQFLENAPLSSDDDVILCVALSS